MTRPAHNQAHDQSWEVDTLTTKPSRLSPFFGTCCVHTRTSVTETRNPTVLFIEIFIIVFPCNSHSLFSIFSFRFIQIFPYLFQVLYCINTILAVIRRSKWPEDMSVSVKPIIIRLDYSCYLLVGWLCLTSHRQRGYLEMAPPFSVPYEGGEAWFLHRPYRESNPRLLRGSPLHNCCATPRPLLLYVNIGE